MANMHLFYYFDNPNQRNKQMDKRTKYEKVRTHLVLLKRAARKVEKIEGKSLAAISESELDELILIIDQLKN